MRECKKDRAILNETCIIGCDSNLVGLLLVATCSSEDVRCNKDFLSQYLETARLNQGLDNRESARIHDEQTDTQPNR